MKLKPLAVLNNKALYVEEIKEKGHTHCSNLGIICCSSESMMSLCTLVSWISGTWILSIVLSTFVLIGIFQSEFFYKEVCKLKF